MEMPNATFPSGDFICGESGGGGGKIVPGKRLDHMEFDSDTLCSGFKLNHDNKPMDDGELLEYQQQQHHQQMSDFNHWLFGDLMFDAAESQPGQTCFKKTDDQEGDYGTEKTEQGKIKKRRYPNSMASLELLRSYGSGLRKLDVDRIIEPWRDRQSNKSSSADERLSIEGILRLAGMKFIQASPPTADLLSVLGPFGLAFSGLSDEEKQEVQLIELLLVCTEKVFYQQFDRARNLLNQCASQFSNQGTPIQRLGFYFADALHDRIDRMTGRVMPEDFRKASELNRDLTVMNPSRTRIAHHQEIPFSQAIHVAGIQAIVEKVAGAKRIHVVDPCIGCGAQWTILMQALQDSELEFLRVTAVGTHSAHLIEDTGRRLESFARSMSLPFSFRLVMVDDFLHLREDHFETDSDFEETLIVYAQFYFRTLISKPNQFDALMKVIVKLRPSLMVVAETEANHNSPSFVNRFIEALFFYGAYFDCLETCMKRPDENRLALESLYFGEAIRNIVAAEGEDRTVRNVTINVWRAFFSRFGLTEAELSHSSVYQASLVTERFSNGRFCTLEKNGKSLVIGWKNTPIICLSAWMFD